MSTILANDTKLKLPDFTLVSASAGSGKTHTLTHRYLQLILSERIPHGSLKNILAITFTNNAAIEMKRRILEFLKKATFGDEKTLQELEELLSLSRDKLRHRAEVLVDGILDAYSEFQVQTIDSFLTRVMRVSALDFDLPAQFDVTLESSALLDESFVRFAERIATDRQEREFVESLIALVNENQGGDRKFIWNPYEALAVEVKNLYNRLSSHLGQPNVESRAINVRELERQIIQIVRMIGDLADKPGLTVSANYHKIIEAAQANNFASLFDRKLDQKVLNKSKDPTYEAMVECIGNLQRELMATVSQYVDARAELYYRPYTQAYLRLLDTIEEVKRRRNEIDLGEASKRLATSLHSEQVPEIYFSLGEVIHHYLIDEFQDTNPIQWATLRPLIEESLGKDGSLFIVGDTKQAIFTFRGGDWRIMDRMLKVEEFASAPCHPVTLPLNYRSAEAIVEFAKKVFHEIVPAQTDTEIADLSGLASYKQQVPSESKGKGYVEVASFEPSDTTTDDPPEKQRLLEILDDCVGRGYLHEDIAILTPKNNHAVRVSGWLNTRGIRFLSHSSLDIRTRRVTGELLALLKFLDSPIDDLSFATVLLSRLFSFPAGGSVAEDMRQFLFELHQSKDRSRALYTTFRDLYPKLWEQWFEHLLNVVGYLPVYDLVAEVYRVFALFETHRHEEATLVKFLEVIREFEASGNNNLKDFLRYAEMESDDDVWNIAIARGENAVTVMTVHKAKGLGFPVVILLFYDSSPRTNNLFIEDAGEAVRLLRITSDWAKLNDRLSAIYETNKALQQVDELNKLYVALTRAQEELYVLSVKGRKSLSPSKLLPPGGFTLGTRGRVEKPVAAPERVAPIIHPPTRGLQQSLEVGRISLEESKRGEFIHALLSRIVYVSENPRIQINEGVEFHKLDIRETYDIPSIKEKIVTLLLNPDLLPYFVDRAGRAVKNEQEIAAANGQLQRLDRLVVDTDGVTVIDYKTGGESDGYPRQVQRYMKLAHELYPALPVHGLLAYVDLNIVQKVE